MTVKFLIKQLLFRGIRETVAFNVSPSLRFASAMWNWMLLLFLDPMVLERPVTTILPTSSSISPLTV